MLYSVELWSRFRTLASPYGKGLLALGRGELSLLDTCLLTLQVAEIEDTGATDFTVLVDFDGVDERGLIREDPFDTDAAGNFPDGESAGVGGGTADLDDHASELLKSVLVTFLDPVGHGDGVTGLELGEAGCFSIGESFFYNLDVIHNFKTLSAQHHKTI